MKYKDQKSLSVDYSFPNCSFHPNSRMGHMPCKLITVKQYIYMTVGACKYIFYAEQQLSNTRDPKIKITRMILSMNEFH